MELTIYNTYVVMESQEQCDRMKQLCIDNNLPYRTNKIAFRFDKDYEPVLEYINEMFAIYNGGGENKNTQVTEQEFINLLNKINTMQQLKQLVNEIDQIKLRLKELTDIWVKNNWSLNESLEREQTGLNIKVSRLQEQINQIIKES